MYSAQNIRYTYITDIRCLYKYLQFYILSWNFINQGFMMYVWCRQKKHNEIFTELSWFRKWFLLREHTFCFYTNPGLLNSAGCASEDSFETVSEPRYQTRIFLEDIWTVSGTDSIQNSCKKKKILYIISYFCCYLLLSCCLLVIISDSVLETVQISWLSILDTRDAVNGPAPGLLRPNLRAGRRQQILPEILPDLR